MNHALYFEDANLGFLIEKLSIFARQPNKIMRFIKLDA